MKKEFYIGDSYDENTVLFSYLEELIQLHRPTRVLFEMSTDEEYMGDITEVEYMGYLPNRMSNDGGNYPFMVVAKLGSEDLLPYITVEATLMKFIPFELAGRKQCFYLDAFEIKKIIFEYEETHQSKAAIVLDTGEDYQSHTNHSYRLQEQDVQAFDELYIKLDEQEAS